jgi:nucleotide-binding universal stress UspA family protein
VSTRSGVTVGVDGSASALRAVRWAAREAAARGVELRIVHAAPNYPELGGLGQVPAGHREWPLATRIASGVVGRARHLAQTAEPGLAVRTSVITGPRSRTLIECSEQAALLVIAARGLDGFAGLHLGSVAGTVSTYARCPVVVVRRVAVAPVNQPAPVVVGVDGSATGRLALGFAFAFADRRHLPLTAVHSWRKRSLHSLARAATDAADERELAEEGQRLLAEALAGWTEHHPDVPVSRVVRRRDSPVEALLSYSPTAELVVVGSRGRGGFSGMLLGSTSQALVRYASGPVAVVRPGTTQADLSGRRRAVQARG